MHSVGSVSGSSPMSATWHLHWVLYIYQWHSSLCLHGSHMLCCPFHNCLQAVQYLTLCEEIQEAAKLGRMSRRLLVALVS